ncbi:hypothetical protein ACTWPB_18800 [Nocardia sp. IBHARD005]|uniref:hypothetical protein n=1 Tax=Nocardia sp. IBHARD005 TaxID=3457765 RepID=UPI004058BF1A
MRRARIQPSPAAAETTAQSALLSVGPVRTYLDDIDTAMSRFERALREQAGVGSD